MNYRKGYSLIELIVVISIMAILMGIAGIKLRDWVVNYNIEKQVKEMFGDLMNVRVRAMEKNREHYIVVSTDGYKAYEDSNENFTYDSGTDKKVIEKKFKYLSNWSGTIKFDTRGLISPNCTIYFNTGNNKPDYDCLVLFRTRINIGSGGASCVAK